MYEYLVLICFALGWWFSIKNSLQTKQTAGKSMAFLGFVILGACCGICHHLFDDLSFKIWIYIVVLVGAALDYAVCYRLRSGRGSKKHKRSVIGYGDRDWSYGSDDYKASHSGEHRRHRHGEGSHKYSSEETRERRSKNERNVGVRADVKEIQFDDIDG